MLLALFYDTPIASASKINIRLCFSQCIVFPKRIGESDALRPTLVKYRIGISAPIEIHGGGRQGVLCDSFVLVLGVPEGDGMEALTSVGNGSGRQRVGRSAIFRDDSTRPIQRAVSKAATKYRMAAIRKQAALEAESPLITDAEAALISI